MSKKEEAYLARQRALGYDPSLAGMDEEDFDYVPSWVRDRQPEQPLNTVYRPVDRGLAERIFKMFQRPFDAKWEMPNLDGPEYRQTLPGPGFDGNSGGNPYRTLEYRVGQGDKDKAVLYANAAGNSQDGSGDGSTGKSNLSDLNMLVDPFGMFPQYDSGGQGGKSTRQPTTMPTTPTAQGNIEATLTKTPSSGNRPPQIAGGDHLGYLSAEGESGSDSGAISSGDGDRGGKSYGAFQFSSEKKVPKEFMTWLATNNPETYARLEAARQADSRDHGPNFDAEWRKIASENPEGFLKMQYDFSKNKYYDRAADAIKEQTGFDFNNRGYALKNALWSRAIHHGEGGVVNVVKNALKNVDLNNATDEQIIKEIYAESGRAGDHGGDYITENSIMADPKHNDWHLQFARENNLLGKSLKYFDGDPTILLGVWNRLNITEPQKALDLLKKHG